MSRGKKNWKKKEGSSDNKNTEKGDNGWTKQNAPYDTIIKGTKKVKKKKLFF